MIIRRNLKLSIILGNIWRPVLVTTALAGVAVYKFANWGQTLLHVPLGAVAMLSGALAIFLAFRNASSYDRWWEARKLWGSLVNLSRTFAREVLTFVAPEQQDAQPLRRSLVLRAAAFAHALRLHLRKQPELMVELSGLLPDAELTAVRASKNAPNQLLLNQGRALAAAYAQGLLNDFRHIQLEQTLKDLTDVLGACERIKNTPLPRQYDYFPRVFLWFYMAVLPFGMVHDLGVFTPLRPCPSPSFLWCWKVWAGSMKTRLRTESRTRPCLPFPGPLRSTSRRCWVTRSFRRRWKRWMDFCSEVLQRPSSSARR